MSGERAQTAAEARAPMTVSAEQRSSALDRINKRPARAPGSLLEWGRVLLLALLLFFVLNAVGVEAFKIPSGSMEETLLVGDFLLVNKTAYGAELPFTDARLPAIRRPRRGDVIVFKWPSDLNKNFVKRLIGLPGDTVAMTRGALVRNGVQVEEQYVQRTDPEADPAGEEFRWQRSHLVSTAEASYAYHPSRNNWGPIVVPANQYFVLGDNRDNSLDSRYWGFVPDSLVRGTPLFVYYSYAPDSGATAPWLTRIRWRRFGARIH